ncbi:hypothetical protein BT69DRAFT_1301887 [Atractiella rhizophila]|nr:hypothetical protein BT69DRAFT_1301887 [Atractiella rhizophila]
MTLTFPSPSIILPPPVFRGFTTIPLHLSRSLSAGAESSEVWMWMDEVLVYWASSLPSRNLLRATTCRQPPGAERWITEINLNTSESIKVESRFKNDKVEVENNMASARTIFSVGVNHSNQALSGERGGRGSERRDGWMMGWVQC